MIIKTTDNIDIVITSDTPFKDSYNVVAYGIQFRGLSGEEKDLLLDGANGKLSTVVQDIVDTTSLSKVSFTIPNGKGNYGTYQPIYSPQFTANGKIILKALKPLVAWNLLGYVLSSMKIVKADSSRNQFDHYVLECETVAQVTVLPKPIEYTEPSLPFEIGDTVYVIKDSVKRFMVNPHAVLGRKGEWWMLETPNLKYPVYRKAKDLQFASHLNGQSSKKVAA